MIGVEKEKVPWAEMGVGEAGNAGERERWESRDGRGVFGAADAGSDGGGRDGVEVSDEAG